MSLPVRTTPEAEGRIRTIDEWWRANRSAAPNRFLDELVVSFDLIGETPLIGRPYNHWSVPGTRRVLLRWSRYHVYYVPYSDEVRVLAVWHAQRGVGPPLRDR